MRPLATGLADQNDRFRRKVLILGEPAIARTLSQSLVAEGFVPVTLEAFTSDPFPQVTDPDCLSRIRSILSSFANLTQESGIVHPANTVWAERPELSNIAHSLGLTVVAPCLRIVSLFNNRLSFLLEAEKLGIPNLALSFDPVHTVREIEELQLRKGGKSPIVLKPVKRGRKFSLFISHNPLQLEKNLPLWLDELRWNSGEVVLFAEKYLEGARQINVPFARFQDGHIQIFPMLDASLQSRFRKLIEYCPPGPCRSEGGEEKSWDVEVEKRLRHWTALLAQEWNFVGVGSLSYLVDGHRAYLIKGHARLSSGFLLWEKVCGTSAVSWQMAALKGATAQESPQVLPVSEWKSGIQLKIFAEDSRFQFPQPGKIQELSEKRHWVFPTGTAELKLNYQAGEEIPIGASGLMGLLMVMSQIRPQLPKISLAVLRDLWIAGSLQTNELFLKEVLSHPWIEEEIFHAGFLDEEFLPNLEIPSGLIPVFGALRDLSEGQSQPKAGTSLKWVEGPSIWKVEKRDSGVSSGQGVSGQGVSGQGVSGRIQFSTGGILRVMAYPLKDRCLVRIGPWCAGLKTRQTDSTSSNPMGPSRCLLPQVTQGAPAAEKKKLAALNAGKVQTILFREGSSVQPHEPMVLLEAFGVFIPHALPIQARVKRWKVKAGDQVSYGQELAELEL